MAGEGIEGDQPTETKQATLLDALNRKRHETDWREKLEKAGFEGNVENALTLLGRYFEGERDDIEFKQKQNRIVEPLIIPDITFISDAELTLAGAQLDKVLINVPKFAKDSKKDPNTQVEYKDEEGVVFYKGSLADYYYLVGIEETDHIIKQQEAYVGWSDADIYGPTKIIHTARVLDADDFEYKALGSRIKIAENAGINPETVNVLRDRLEVARQERQIQKKPKNDKKN